MPPGTYTLFARFQRTSQASPPWPVTYFPGTRDLASVISIEVGGATERDGADFAVRRGGGAARAAVTTHEASQGCAARAVRSACPHRRSPHRSQRAVLGGDYGRLRGESNATEAVTIRPTRSGVCSCRCPAGCGADRRPDISRASRALQRTAPRTSDTNASCPARPESRR